MKGVRETFSRYDSADYLKTEADIAAYLEACAEEAPNDPVFMLKALGTVARARNMSQLAEAAGMTRAGLYKALSGEGKPLRLCRVRGASPNSAAPGAGRLHRTWIGIARSRQSYRRVLFVRCGAEKA